MRAAVEQNPDFRLVKVDGRERVVLVPEALERLQELNPRPGQISGDQPPRKLLANAATHADQAIRFGILKLSLLQSFLPEDSQESTKANSLFNLHPQLTSAKADLLDRPLMS